MNITSLFKRATLLIKTHFKEALLFSLVLLSIFIVYGNDLSILANEALQNEALTYVLLMPFLVGFLFYLKKDVVKASLTLDKQYRQKTKKYINEVLGVILCIAALLLYWYGSYTFYPLEIHLMSLPLFVAGITLFLLNSRALLMLTFPILFLLFLVPIPNTLIHALGGTLANANTQISYTILSTLGIPLELSTAYGAPAVLLTSAAGQQVNFAVDVSCSGIYSLVTYIILASFLAFITYTSIFKKIIVFAIGFLIFTILNPIRIMTILTFGYLLGEETALLVHSVSGFILIFTGMLLVITLSEKALKIQITTKPPTQQSCPECKPKLQKPKAFCSHCGKHNASSRLHPSKSTLKKILILLIGVSIATVSISAPTFATIQDSLEFTSITDPQDENTSSLPEIPGYTLRFLYRDTRYETITKQDASLVYGYGPTTNSSNHVIYAVIGVANTISQLHNWEVCFITYQVSQGQSPLVSVQESREIQLYNNPPLIAHYLVFENPDGYTQSTLYWYQKAAYKTELTIEQKYIRISLIILTKNLTDHSLIQEELYTTGQQILEKWEPMKTQALLSLGVPAQQTLLAISIAFVIITKTGQYFTERKKTLNNLGIFRTFASPKEKIILNTIQDIAKEKRHMTTKDIIDHLQKKVKRTINPKRVIHILKTIEAQGFITRTIISKGNTPIVVWKTKMQLSKNP
jgi:exosortase